MKRYVYLLSALLFSGCAHLSSPLMPGTGLMPESRLVPDKGKAPKYAIATVLPNVKPHGTMATVYSLHVSSTIGRRRYTYVAETQVGCPASDASGFTGCQVVSESTAKLKKAVFIFYSKPKAKGCQLAIATYKGSIAVDTTVPLTFKPLNTKKCW